MSLDKGPEITHRQCLGEGVSHVVLGVDIENLDTPIVDYIFDIVMNDVNVLGSGFQLVVSTPRDGSSTITLNGRNASRETKLIE